MHDLYIDGNEEGPQIIAPTDERARDILDGFRMYALLCTYPFPHWLAFFLHSHMVIGCYVTHTWQQLDEHVGCRDRGNFVAGR